MQATHMPCLLLLQPRDRLFSVLYVHFYSLAIVCLAFSMCTLARSMIGEVCVVLAMWPLLGKRLNMCNKFACRSSCTRGSRGTHPRFVPK